MKTTYSVWFKYHPVIPYNGFAPVEHIATRYRVGNSCGHLTPVKFESRDYASEVGQFFKDNESHGDFEVVANN